MGFWIWLVVWGVGASDEFPRNPRTAELSVPKRVGTYTFVWGLGLRVEGRGSGVEVADHELPSYPPTAYTRESRTHAVKALRLLGIGGSLLHWPDACRLGFRV